jgi:hypothetical protein
MSQKCWRIPLGRPSVVMINLSIRNILISIGRERIRVNSIRRDSNHSHIIIERKEINLLNQVEVYINRTFHIKVEIGQQSRKGKE